MSVAFHMLYRYFTFMGYGQEMPDNFEPLNCDFKFRNITPTQYNLPIKNTVDSDMLSNGLCFFLSSFEYRLETTLEKNLNQNSVFMLDTNYMLNPLHLKIFDKTQKNLIEPDYLNLFSLSVYQDNQDGIIKIIAGNSKRQNEIFSLEKFIYNTNLFSLIHQETFQEGLDLQDLCDLVALDDGLVYFTKCFSNSFLKEVKISLEIKSGEIWLLDTNQKIAYMVAENLFLPKAISYLQSQSLILVSNQAVEGLSLFRKENDNSLTRLQDIQLKNFVFNINIDIFNDILLTLHPMLFKTRSLKKHIESGIPTKLAKLKLVPIYGQYVINDFEYLFSTNGSLLNALSSSQLHNNNLILFSLLNDPKICKLKI